MATDPVVVAIDGPAGAGKSTIGKALARHLGLTYLDTGAMFRAVAWLARHHGIDPRSATEIAELARSMDLIQTEESVVVDGHDVTADIRTIDIGELTSIVATHADVRAELRTRQREWAERNGGGVIEGRDIGTVVFPDAVLKVYLDASPRVRAERRVAQTGGSVDEVEAAIAERDARDRGRSDAPLRHGPDAVLVDTSDRSIDDVVTEIERLVKERLSWRK